MPVFSIDSDYPKRHIQTAKSVKIAAVGRATIHAQEKLTDAHVSLSTLLNQNVIRVLCAFVISEANDTMTTA